MLNKLSNKFQILKFQTTKNYFVTSVEAEKRSEKYVNLDVVQTGFFLSFSFVFLMMFHGTHKHRDIK